MLKSMIKKMMKRSEKRPVSYYETAMKLHQYEYPKESFDYIFHMVREGRVNQILSMGK